MSERVVVPETRIKAVADRMQRVVHRDVVRDACNAFAADLSEHPIVPTNAQVQAMQVHFHERTPDHSPALLIVEWQRRMFRAPEPEVPEAVEDLLYTTDQQIDLAAANEGRSDPNDRILEAYRRGLRGK